MKRLLPISIVLVGLGLLYPLQQWIDRTAPREVISDESLYFTSGETIKKLSLGLDGIVADIYWIRAVQYFGNKLLESGQPLTMNSTRTIRMDLLAPLLNIIVNLDPQHLPAYRFGAIFLPERDMPAAIALLERGIRENPNEWRLYQDIGYIYWQAGDYAKAAKYYEQGGEIAGAPRWMRDMAGVMMIKGGSRETARAIYSSYAESEDQQIRKQAIMRLEQLAALDDLDLLNAAMECYRQQTGRCPDDLRILIAEFRKGSFLECLRAKLEIPAKELQEHIRNLRVNKEMQITDPEGFAYALDEKNCRADIALSSPIPRT